MLSKYVKLPSLQHLKKSLALLMKISSPKYRHFAQNFYSLSIHSSPWSYQLNLSRLQSFTFAVFILVTMFFHFTHFVFYLIHYRSIPYERLKPIVTFFTSFTARFSHINDQFFFSNFSNTVTLLPTSNCFLTLFLIP